MLRDEFHALVPGGATPGIAKSAVLLEEFLAKEADGKRLELPLKPLSGRQVAVHGHCHQKAFGAMKSMRKVVGLIPELEVEWIESSCCGMAGSFGLEAEHAKVSMQMAELSLLPAIRTVGEHTDLVANGSSCRHQIRDGVQRPSQHVAELLAEALG
jgi:Fe-S oxidoreductase